MDTVNSIEYRKNIIQELSYRGYIIIPFVGEQNHFLEEEIYTHIVDKLTEKEIEKALNYYFSDKIFPEKKNFITKNNDMLLSEIQDYHIIFNPKDMVNELSPNILTGFDKHEKEEVLKIVFKNINNSEFARFVQNKKNNFCELVN